jgi:hypothetical protein
LTISRAQKTAASTQKGASGISDSLGASHSSSGYWRILASDLGISIRRGVSVTAFSQADDTVTIHTSAGTVRASWLIGCDGGRSTVRKLAGFAFPEQRPKSRHIRRLSKSAILAR